MFVQKYFFNFLVFAFQMKFVGRGPFFALQFCPRPHIVRLLRTQNMEAAFKWTFLALYFKCYFLTALQNKHFGSVLFRFLIRRFAFSHPNNKGDRVHLDSLGLWQFNILLELSSDLNTLVYQTKKPNCLYTKLSECRNVSSRRPANLVWSSAILAPWLFAAGGCREEAESSSRARVAQCMQIGLTASATDGEGSWVGGGSGVEEGGVGYDDVLSKGPAAIACRQWSTLFARFLSTLSQVIYAGDSASDEFAIGTLKGVAYTFRVTNEDSSGRKTTLTKKERMDKYVHSLLAAITKTKADYWLSGPGGVLDLLRFLERKLLGRSPKTISRASSIVSVHEGWVIKRRKKMARTFSF